MKKRIILLFITLSLSAGINAVMSKGFITFVDSPRPGRMDRTEIPYLIDEASYVTGGVTFTYPTNWFSMTPMVNVSIKINVPFLTTDTWSAVVVSSDVTQAHVSVTKFDGITMTTTEAGPGDVTVTIYSVSQP